MMKRTIFLLVGVIFASMITMSQNVVFHENFELPSNADSVVATTTGTTNWAINTTYSNSGVQSFHKAVEAGDSATVTTLSFSTLGAYVVYLEFSHICKIEYQDYAEIYVSNNGGTSWIKLTGAEYTGSGSFASWGNCFSSVSYPEWTPGDNNLLPTNAWWRDESFNISSLVANSSDVMVRFVLRDGGTMGGLGAYGWLLDDIKIWTPSMQEASVEGIILPLSLPSGCGLTNETIQIRIANNGAQNISGNLTASFHREGQSAVTENVTATIVPFDTLTYTFSSPIDLSSPHDTAYFVKVWLSLLNDPNQANDTITDTLISKVALPDPVISDVTIPYATSVTLTALHTDSITWSTDPLGDIRIHYGASYTTPVLYDTATYYVQAGASSAGAFIITEICHFKTTNGAPVGGWPSYLITDDYIEITGVPNSDLGGFTLEQWSATALLGTHTFPQGTLLGQNGTAVIAVGQLGSSTPSPSNFYYHGNGSYTGTFGSTTVAGRIIKDPSGAIIDAVGYGTYTFPAAAGVTSADWSGNTPAVSSSGNRLEGPYTKDATNWVNSGVSPQDPNTLNSGVQLPAPSGCPSRVIPVTVNVSGIPNIDAGISEIIEPVGSIASGVATPISVNLKNYGPETITKVDIHHTINGVAQPVYNWTGNLPYDSVAGPITINTQTFSVGVANIVAWTNMPNDSIDIANHNDTAKALAYTCLAGTLTLGSGGDIGSFSELISIIDSAGICGNTTINILPGTYTEQLSFIGTQGLSNAQRLIFQSSTGNPADVTIEYSANAAADNWVVKFDGVGFIEFRNLTVKATGAANGRVFEFANGANNILIDSCIIETNTTATGTAFAGIFSTTNAPSNHIRVTNNRFIGGYYGIYWFGSAANRQNYLLVANNTFEDFHYYGIYTSYTDSLFIHNNVIRNRATSEIVYGIYHNYTTGYGEVYKNKVFLTGTSSQYGIRVGNKQNTSTNYITVANNFVYQGGATGTVYALYLNASNFVNLYYNSVHVTGGSATGGRGLYHTTGSNINIVNNIFANTGGGYTVYINTAAAINNMDFNNFYTTGNNLAYWGAARATLAALRTASGKDANSHNIIPGFTAPDNLYLLSTDLSTLATPLSLVTDDIDGSPRGSQPTIGAHEVPLIAFDAGVTSIITPAPNTGIGESHLVTPSVVVQNHGSDTITSMSIGYTVNGGAVQTTPFTGQIVPGGTATLTLVDYTAPAGVTEFCAFTILTGDSNTFNDTSCVSYYSIPLIDGNLTRIIPIDNDCGKGLDTVKIVVANIGTQAITVPFTASYQIEGSASVVTETLSSSILSGDSIQYSFSALADFSVTGADSTFRVNAWINVTGDNVQLNDSAFKEVTSFFIPDAPVISDVTIPYASYTTLTAISSDTVVWYATDTSTVELAQGNSFTTPVLYDTTTYWVEAVSGSSMAALGSFFITEVCQFKTATGAPIGGWPSYLLADDYIEITGLPNSDLGGITLEQWSASAMNGTYTFTQGTYLSPGGTAVIAVGQLGSSAPSPANYYYHGNGTFTGNYGSTGVAGRILKNANGDIIDAVGYGTYTFPAAAGVTSADWSGNTPAVSSSGNRLAGPYTKDATNWINSGISPQDPNQLNNGVSLPKLISGACASARIPVKVNVAGIPPYDLAVTELIVKDGCALYQESVSIRVLNQGTDTAFGGISTSFRIDNNPWVATETISSAIAPGDTVVYTYNALADLTAPLSSDTNFTIYVWVNMAGDPNQQNDSINRFVMSLETPSSPTVANVSIPYGSSVTISAQTPDSVFWFADQTSNQFIGTGNSYTTPLLYDTTTYWVESANYVGGGGIYDVGTGTGTNGNWDYPSPYVNYYESTKQQYLILASEMHAAGMIAGEINSLAFNVAAINGTPLQGFYFRIGHTTLTSLSSSFIMTGLTTVFSVPSYTETAGWNVHNFSTPYMWDGLSNIVIETCNESYNYSAMASVYLTNTPFISSIVYDDYMGACQSSYAYMTYSRRPNMRFDSYSLVPSCPSLRVPLKVSVSTPPPADAGIASVVSPAPVIQSNTTVPVSFTVHNYGMDTLTNVIINWEVDGVLQQPYTATGLSIPQGHVSSPIQIGTSSFLPGLRNIKAWTSMPNGVVDNINTNDTLTSIARAALWGIYTLGTPVSDFPTFGDALTALIDAGLYSHVVFEIDSGIYNAQLHITNYAGLDSNATITFRSANNTNTDVVIQFAPPSSAANYVVFLDGASYISFEDVTIKNTSTSNGRVVVLQNGAHYNRFEGCIIETGVSTSSTFAGFYSATTSSDNYNVFRNNEVINGYYSIYMYGSAANMKIGTVIENNIFRDYQYYGVHAYYTDSLHIVGNTFSNRASATTAYHLRTYYNNGYGRIAKNKIHATNTGTTYGITVGNTSPTIAHPNFDVSNNFFAQENATGTVYGLYLISANSVNVYYNSVNLTGGSATGGRSLFLSSGSGNRVLNNVFVNTGGGYAYYVSSAASVAVSNHNNYFSSGPALAYWTAIRSTLADLRTANSMDVNSVNVLPLFASVSDLHTNTIDLNGAATPIAGIIDDIDGDLRHPVAPDIGADEFFIVADDAGIEQIVSPTTPLIAGNANVLVRLRNFGSATLTNVTVNWSVNGVLQTPYSWTGNLPTSATVPSLNIGNFTFGTGANNITAWTSMPNGVVDGFPYNDTASSTVIVCTGFLRGTYTIGGIGADYNNVTDAVQSLIYCGIDSSVVFLLAPGTYNEQLHFTAIPGASKVNTVTFRSATGDSTSAIIQHAASSTLDNYVIYLDGASHIHFRQLTVRATGSGVGRTIVLENGANFNHFEACVLETSVSTNTNFAVVHTHNTSSERHNVFRGNRILNGYHGFYIYGNTTNRNFGFVIENNEISGFHYYGINAYYTDSLHISGNTITNGGSSGVAYHIRAYYNSGYGKITKNKIHATNSSTTYGIAVGYATLQPFEISNNFISQVNSTGTVYGIYLIGTASTAHVYYNSVNITGGSVSGGRAFFQSSGSQNRVVNNSFSNTGGGWAAYYTNNTHVIESNHNNYYSTGSNFVYSGTAYNNLAAMQTGTGRDGNSVSTDPMYYSVSDLHSMSPILFGGATPIPSITDDIDGDPRHATAPCIGADEFVISANDIGPFEILQPAISYTSVGTSVTVQVRVRNNGTDTVTAFDVSYVYAGQPAVNSNWTGQLLSGQMVDFTFTTPFAALAGQHNLTIYTTMPGDQNANNDTISMLYTGVPVLIPGWSDDFDGPVNYWAAGGSQNLWQRGVPSGSIINNPYSAPNVYATNLSGQYGGNAEEYLYSPFFNFSSISGATLSFRQWSAFADNNDGVQLQVTANGGTTWSTIGYMGDPLGTNWYNHASGGQHYFTSTTAGWVHSTFDMSAWNNAANPLQFRFRFFSNASGHSDGFAIDDFEISVPQIATDGGVSRILSPPDSTVSQSQVQVVVRLKNYGNQPLNAVPVKYRVNNQTPVSALYAGNILPGDSTDYTFLVGFTSPSSNYVLKVWTEVVGDIYKSNDTARVSVRALALPLDIGVTQIVSPLNDTTYYTPGEINEVSVWVRNFGTQAVSNFQIEYSLGAVVRATETYSDTLLAGDSVLYIFNQLYTTPMGSYNLCAKTILSGDADPSNDGSCRQMYGTVGIQSDAGSALTLSQNRPNPALYHTIIDYHIPKSGNVVFEVRNILGQPVYREEGSRSAGGHRVELDINALPAGVYSYGIIFDGHRISRKMIIAK